MKQIRPPCIEGIISQVPKGLEQCFCRLERNDPKLFIPMRRGIIPHTVKELPFSGRVVEESPIEATRLSRVLLFLCGSGEWY